MALRIDRQLLKGWSMFLSSSSPQAGVGSAMCSYNRINGTYACENPQTLADLKETMGFRGWMMSDWGATHSTTNAILAGLDQEVG